MKNKLIINSLIRKKESTIYFILLVLIFTVLIVLNILLSNLQESRKNNFYNNSLALIQETSDILGKLSNEKMIGEVKRIAFFDDTEDEIIKEPRVNNKVIVIEDSTLLDHQIDICLNDDIDVNYTSGLSQGQSLAFMFKDNEYTFKIRNIAKQKHINSIKVSTNTFNKILSLSDDYNYIFKLYVSEDEIRSEYSNVQMLTGSTEEEFIIINRINQYIKLLIIFNIIIIAIFSIMIFIISHNISNDLKRNIMLENILGFNQTQIVKNIIIRLLLLDLVSLVIAIILSIIISLLINIFYKLNILCITFSLAIIEVFIVIISNIYAIHKGNRIIIPKHNK